MLQQVKKIIQNTLIDSQFSGGTKQKSKRAEGSNEDQGRLKFRNEDISSAENFENFLMKNREEIRRESKEATKNAYSLMRMYNFQPREQPTDKTNLTAREHIEHTFWAFEQILSHKKEIEKIVSSKKDTRSDGPEKGRIDKI